MSTNNTGPTKKVKVWDLPLRLFHWLLLIAVSAAFITIWAKSDRNLHMLAGYSVLTLLLFRLVWGFIGGEHARFFNFVKGPARVLSYMGALFGGRHDPNRTGHNALGALSVLAMLLSLLFQAVSGLFNFDDDLNEGPLRKLISESLADKLHEAHEINQWIILGLIVLHVLAILFYRFGKKDNLVSPMITGSKTLPADATTADARGGNTFIGAVVLAISAGAVWYVVTKL
ncbi:MAG TPA: cytochrome b/b6 domain-containing protein [Rhodocyclaceae bacterium]|nr:cytochrome b/b6 domain-containing protein [Rhodocyclaceae bacterium]